MIEKREHMELFIRYDDNDDCYIRITTPTETFGGLIDKSYSDGFYCDMAFIPNDYIFEKALIKDIYSFQEEVLGYSTNGQLPYCYTREDVIKLVKVVVDHNNRQFEIENKENEAENKGDLSLNKRKQRKHIKFNFKL